VSTVMRKKYAVPALVFWLTFVFCCLSRAGAEKIYGKFFSDGSPKKMEFALTYDDGPGLVTEALVKLLDKYGAKATFFVTGAGARRYPAKAALAAASGHLVGNHTDTHADYRKAAKGPEPEKFLERELDKASAAIEKAAGKKPVFLRMPNGYDRPWVRAVAARKGYVLVNWTYGSDWTRIPEAEMTAAYLKQLKPGAILLLHDGGGKSREKTLRITEALLKEAGVRGLKPVTLAVLLEIETEKDKTAVK